MFGRRSFAPGLVLLWMMSAHAAANEADFVFLTAMPNIDGIKIRSVTRKDPAAGITFKQTTFMRDTGAFAVSTYVVAASCADAATVPENTPPYIIALKYQPKSPKTFAVAGLHDIFRDVYVRDRQGKVRAYENMGGREMIELTETFRPDCPGI